MLCLYHAKIRSPQTHAGAVELTLAIDSSRTPRCPQAPSTGGQTRKRDVLRAPVRGQCSLRRETRQAKSTEIEKHS